MSTLKKRVKGELSQLKEKKITVDDDLFEWLHSGKDLATDSKVRTKSHKVWKKCLAKRVKRTVYASLFEMSS